jgi:hypothetical protein
VFSHFVDIFIYFSRKLLSKPDKNSRSCREYFCTTCKKSYFFYEISEKFNQKVFSPLKLLRKRVVFWKNRKISQQEKTWQFIKNFARNQCIVMVITFSRKCKKRLSYLTAGIPDCPASVQSGTGLKKINDTGTSPVPE